MGRVTETYRIVISDYVRTNKKRLWERVFVLLTLLLFFITDTDNIQ